MGKSMADTTHMTMREFTRWKAFLDAFRSVYPEMSPQMIMTFLHVATFESASQSDLAKKIGVTQAAISRHVRELTKRGKMKLDLVTLYEDPTDYRRTHMKLTSRGIALVETLKRIP
jgi:DNA-binding MarR family transcriptional regulator